MGAGESGECGFNRIEAGQAQTIGGWQATNCSRSAGEMGEGAGGEEIGSVEIR